MPELLFFATTELEQRFDQTVTVISVIIDP